MTIDLLHFRGGQPFGLRVYDAGGLATVQCPTCGRWSAIKAEAVTHEGDGPTVTDPERRDAFLICGYDDCAQEFTITGGITTLPFGERHGPR